MEFSVHPSAVVEKNVKIGRGTKIWHFSHVREGAEIGENCTLGHSAFVDQGVRIGNSVKIENKACIFRGVTLEDEVFVGPHAAFTNDDRPRSVGDWKVMETVVRKGASIGVNSTVMCGTVIGEYAMVGGGAVVTKDVPANGMVYGNPARLKGFVCKCGKTLDEKEKKGSFVVMECRKCSESYKIGIGDYDKMEKCEK